MEVARLRGNSLDPSGSKGSVPHRIESGQALSVSKGPA